MRTPSFLQLVILSLAVFRLTRLAGWDDLTIKLRGRLTRVQDSQHAALVHAVEHTEREGLDPWTGGTRMAAVGRHRYYLSKMIRCPWCAGWWISLAWWAAWQLSPTGILIASTPFAISAIVGLVAKNLDEH